HGGGHGGPRRQTQALDIEATLSGLSRALPLARTQQQALRSILTTRHAAMLAGADALRAQINMIDRLDVAHPDRAAEKERLIAAAQQVLRTQMEAMAFSRERMASVLSQKQRARLGVIGRSGNYTEPLTHWP
ncbi:MAG: hypothetical protein AAF899_06430, partial [Pseudomonadota bacterium]